MESMTEILFTMILIVTAGLGALAAGTFLGRGLARRRYER